jgi:DNA-binding MarR family transcriptional regulator
MNPETLLFEALKQLKAQSEQCHLELSKEINISELKIKQFHYLEIINQHEYLTFSHFAEILNITKPSVTAIVNQLIKLDCVYKQQCSHDGRRYYVELSEKGQQIVQFKNLEIQRLAKKISHILTETEIEIFVRLINKIVNTR